MTRKERIAILKEAEKAIYGYARHLDTSIPMNYRHTFRQGLLKAKDVLYNKRKRLEKQLKK